MFWRERRGVMTEKKRISVSARIIWQFLLIVTGLFTQQANVEAGEWGLGVAGVRYQPPLKGANSESAMLPYIYYEGNRLSVDFQQISYRLIAGENFEFSVLGQLRLQGYDPGNNIALAGMEKREPSIDAGFSATFSKDWGALGIVAVTDVDDVHNGQEVDLFYSFPIPGRRWLLEPVLGVSWLSQDLVDYYYGVRASEAQPGRPEYQGHSALNIFTEISLTYELTTHWFAFGGANYTFLDDSIRNNSIIESNHELTSFLGLVYVF